MFVPKMFSSHSFDSEETFVSCSAYTCESYQATHFRDVAMRASYN